MAFLLYSSVVKDQTELKNSEVKEQRKSMTQKPMFKVIKASLVTSVFHYSQRIYDGVGKENNQNVSITHFTHRPMAHAYLSGAMGSDSPIPTLASPAIPRLYNQNHNYWDQR